MDFPNTWFVAWSREKAIDKTTKWIKQQDRKTPVEVITLNLDKSK